MGLEERQVIVEELKKELVKEQEGYVDEKTGHIYIKDDGGKEKGSNSSDYAKQIGAATGDIGLASWHFMARSARSSGAKIYALGKSWATKISSSGKNDAEKKKMEKQKELPIYPTIPEKKNAEAPEDRPMEMPLKPKTGFLKERLFPRLKKNRFWLISRKILYQSFLINRVLIPLKTFFILLARSTNQLARSLIAKYKARKTKTTPEEKTPDQTISHQITRERLRHPQQQEKKKKNGSKLFLLKKIWT